MLAVCLCLLSFYHAAYSHVLPIPQPTYSTNYNQIQCVSHIVTKYFSPEKVLTLVDKHRRDDDGFHKAVNDLNAVAILTKHDSKEIRLHHKGYFFTENNYTSFTETLLQLTKDATWNPGARFFIVLEDLEDYHLKPLFDTLLIQHMTNVLVMNGSSEADLYTYNPFDNYACGKRYDEIISYGRCSESYKRNLFPDKLVTGLRNCSFKIAISKWAPFSVIPSNESDTTKRLAYGIEPYLFKTIAEVHGFKMIVMLDDSEVYARVSKDLNAVGLLKRIQDKEADGVLGGVLLTPDRAEAFDYVDDLMPYVDELRYMVKRATVVPAWKNIYLEFNATVWMLILLSISLYSILMVMLLRAEDRSHIVLKLLENLILHGCKMKGRWKVKCFFIIWVWYAYLINAFYQSSFYSLTTRPVMEHQIKTVKEMVHHKLKPCFSKMLLGYIDPYDIHNISNTPGCENAYRSAHMVMDNPRLYSIVMYAIYNYNRRKFYNEYGISKLYTLRKAYNKVTYCVYFYKGFPMTENISHTAIRLREMGLANKLMADMTYKNNIKHRFHAKTYGSRFVMPWGYFIVGLVFAVLTLIIELLNKHK